MHATLHYHYFTVSNDTNIPIETFQCENHNVYEKPICSTNLLEAKAKASILRGQGQGQGRGT